MNALANSEKNDIALLKALDIFIDRKEYSLGYQIGEILLDRNNLNYAMLKKMAVCAVYSKKQRVMLNKLINLNLENQYIYNLIAGLAGKLGEQKLSIEYANKLASLKPLIRSGRKDEKIRVLVLQTIASGEYKFMAKTMRFKIGEGHNNLMSILDTSIAKDILRVDNLESSKEVIKEINNIDLIYNSITDPERGVVALNNAEKLCDLFTDIPILNHPKNVKLSSRESNFERFSSNKNLIFPKVIKLREVNGNCKDLIVNTIKNEKINYPVIVRLAGYQAGKNMYKIDYEDHHDFTDFDEILNKKALDIYIIEFKDCSFKDERIKDGILYPKFRAFMVNGELIPIHLFVSNNDYNVHRDNSLDLMENNPWLIEIEKKYCENALSVINENIWSDLTKTLNDTGLDYVGVDFSVNLGEKIENQQCIIFEINAAMRNSINSLSARKHTKKNWHYVTTKTHDYICQLTNKKRWEYSF